MGCYYNKEQEKSQIVSNKFIVGSGVLNQVPNIIVPDFPVANTKWEKNWVFYEANGTLCVIYQWYPIYCCQIDYSTNKLKLIKKIDCNSIFSRFRGSTCGVNFDNKIWFIVHQQKSISDDEFKGYVHNFVVFDTNMNLIGLSKAFNFENALVEYCIGFEITNNNNFLITYSTLDCSTKLAVFSPLYISRLVHWTTTS
jgi:hypothetical protein